MESGNPFTYMFKSRDWVIDYLATVGILFGVLILYFIISFAVVLPSFTPFLSSQPPAAPGELSPSFANLFQQLAEIIFYLVLGLAISSIVGGYFLRVIGNIIRGSATPVRGWSGDFGHLLLGIVHNAHLPGGGRQLCRWV